MVVIEQRDALPSGKTTLTSTLAFKSPTSPILELPAEIRLMIWRHVLISDRPVGLRKHKNRELPNSRLRSGEKFKFEGNPQYEYSTQFSLALTCRQVYLEATPIYYGENSFLPQFVRHLDMYETYSVFLDVIGDRNANRISETYLDVCLATSVDFLHRLKGLKILNIESYDLHWWNDRVERFFQRNKDLVVLCCGKVIDTSE